MPYMTPKKEKKDQAPLGRNTQFGNPFCELRAWY